MQSQHQPRLALPVGDLLNADPADAEFVDHLLGIGTQEFGDIGHPNPFEAVGRFGTDGRCVDDRRGEGQAPTGDDGHLLDRASICSLWMGLMLGGRLLWLIGDHQLERGCFPLAGRCL